MKCTTGCGAKKSGETRARPERRGAPKWQWARLRFRLLLLPPSLRGRVGLDRRALRLAADARASGRGAVVLEAPVRHKLQQQIKHLDPSAMH